MAGQLPVWLEEQKLKLRNESPPSPVLPIAAWVEEAPGLGQGGSTLMRRGGKKGVGSLLGTIEWTSFQPLLNPQDDFGTSSLASHQ